MKKAAMPSILVAVVLLALGAIAEAQQPGNMPRIGFLRGSRPPESHIEAFRRGLKDFGYVEGQNIATEYRYAEGKLDRVPELAAELVRLKVDIIVVAGGATSSRTAKNATKTISIVMMGQGLDPVEAGHVDSLARPGGNVTGLTNLGIELGGKKLELLKEAVPKVARVAMLYDPSNTSTAREVQRTRRPWDNLVQHWRVHHRGDSTHKF
jgi:putative ABC transport system substrate-binding protein